MVSYLKSMLHAGGLPIQAVEVSASRFLQHAVEHVIRMTMRRMLATDGLFCINSSLNWHNWLLVVISNDHLDAICCSSTFLHFFGYPGRFLSLTSKSQFWKRKFQTKLHVFSDGVSYTLDNKWCVSAAIFLASKQWRSISEKQFIAVHMQLIGKSL